MDCLRSCRLRLGNGLFYLEVWDWVMVMVRVLDIEEWGLDWHDL